MKSKKISDSQNIIAIILTIVTIVIFFFGVMFFFDFIVDYKYDISLPHKKSTIEYQVDFPVRLAEEVREDRMHDPDNKGLQEYYALGEFIDSKMQIGINTALGKDDLVSYYKEMNSAARENSGSLKSYAEKYDSYGK